MNKNKKIKVAMVAHDFPLAAGILNGGVAAAVFYLCEALQKTGEIELDIIRPLAPKGCSGVISVAGMRVHALEVPAWQARNLHLHWFMRNLVRDKLRELQPDVIHVQGHSVVAAALPPDQTVLTIHGILAKDVLFRGRGRWLKSKLIGLMEKYAHKRVENIISISPYIQQQVAPNRNHRFWNIANPVAPQYFDIKREPRSGIVFCAAKITERKNISGLIRAFAGLLKVMPEAELRLAGSLEDQSYVQHCHDLAGSLQISNRVRFLGTLNILQVQRELAQAGCLALCSYQESAPVAIGEAMAAGVPVLASNVGGVAFMVEDGVTGRMVNPHDDDGIKQPLVKLLMQDNLSAMGAAAKTKALAEYHSIVVARKTLGVYQSLLGRRA